jgi:hypothetical protein
MLRAKTPQETPSNGWPLGRETRKEVVKSNYRMTKIQNKYKKDRNNLLIFGDEARGR